MKIPKKEDIVFYIFIVYTVLYIGYFWYTSFTNPKLTQTEIFLEIWPFMIPIFGLFGLMKLVEKKKNNKT